MKNIVEVKAELNTILNGLIGEMTLSDGSTIPAIRATDEEVSANVKGLEVHISRLPVQDTTPMYASSTQGTNFWRVRCKWWGGVDLADYAETAGDVAFWRDVLSAVQHRILNTWKPVPAQPTRVPRNGTLDTIEELRFLLPDRFFVRGE